MTKRLTGLRRATNHDGDAALTGSLRSVCALTTTVPPLAADWASCAAMVRPEAGSGEACRAPSEAPDGSAAGAGASAPPVTPAGDSARPRSWNSIRLAPSASTRASSCVTMITAEPSSRAMAMSFTISVHVAKSCPKVGSSMMSTLGAAASIEATDSRRFSPPDSV